MSAKKRILICPLNWGLGHATRCIPIIRALLDHDFEPVIASSARPGILLQEAFPALEYIHFPDYDIRYGKHMMLSMLVQFPKLVFRIRKEHKQLKNIIAKHHIDAVFSDNRFGLYTEEVPCIYMTHQLAIQTPLGKGILFRMHRWFIRKYDACWVPDVSKSPNLSGALSHVPALDKHIKFIGPLSRFSKQHKHEVEPNRLLIILSGPEPQRTLLEEKLRHSFKNYVGKVVLVRGITESKASYTEENLKVIDAPSTEDLQKEIEKARWIVSRPGYSSMMDYSYFNKKLILIPTPGQTEQEYLASYYQQNNKVVCLDQTDFDLTEALKKADDLGPFHYNISEERDWETLFRFFKRKRKS